MCCRCLKEPIENNKKHCKSCIDNTKKKIYELKSKRKKEGLCVYCGKTKEDKSRSNCSKCNKTLTEGSIKYQKRIVNEVLKAYGNKCNCCGESNKEFLQLDHVNNDGAEHRKKVKTFMYGWAKHNNFPDTLQLLCANCNFSKMRSGICIHDRTWLNSIKQL